MPESLVQEAVSQFDKIVIPGEPGRPAPYPCFHRGRLDRAGETRGSTRLTTLSEVEGESRRILKSLKDWMPAFAGMTF